jgi:hypothetical protein
LGSKYAAQGGVRDNAGYIGPKVDTMPSQAILHFYHFWPCLCMG